MSNSCRFEGLVSSGSKATALRKPNPHQRTVLSTSEQLVQLNQPDLVERSQKTKLKYVTFQEDQMVGARRVSSEGWTGSRSRTRWSVSRGAEGGREDI